MEKILHLQRTIGNPVVQRLIESGTIQAKLRIGQPNDAYEMEADRLADRVMRMPAPDMPVQSPGVTPGIESSINSLKGGGQPLSPSTRAYFEPRFGTDFSHVRVHTGARAVQTAGAINAKAYTVGNNIVFNHSEYSPGTTSGKTLLAHELTHTIQQNSSQIRQKGYNGLSDNIIQRRFEPENASEAMVGQLFVLSEPYLVIGFGGSFAHLYKGDIVKVLRWENNRDFVTAIQYFNFRLNNNGSFFSVPKYLLRPYKPANTGDLAYYGTEIDQQAASIKRGRKDLDNAQNIPGSLGQAERRRIPGLQHTRQRDLN
ncbi:MAG: DUF4157 domain-containing protein, partial [bacterium]|nr:DUF4157 domain-containing protein [bacterium]